MKNLANTLFVLFTLTIFSSSNIQAMKEKQEKKFIPTANRIEEKENSDKKIMAKVLKRRKQYKKDCKILSNTLPLDAFEVHRAKDIWQEYLYSPNKRMYRGILERYLELMKTLDNYVVKEGIQSVDPILFQKLQEVRRNYLFETDEQSKKIYKKVFPTGHWIIAASPF